MSCVHREPNFRTVFRNPARSQRSVGPPKKNGPCRHRSDTVTPIANLGHLSLPAIFSSSISKSKNYASGELPRSSSGSFLSNKFLKNTDLSLISCVLQSVGAWWAPQNIYWSVLTNSGTRKEKSLFSRVVPINIPCSFYLLSEIWLLFSYLWHRLWQSKPTHWICLVLWQLAGRVGTAVVANSLTNNSN